VSAPAKRLPWYRRLAFRLAVLVTLLLLGFDFVAPHVYTLLYGLLVEDDRPFVYALSNEPDEAAKARRAAVDRAAIALLDGEPAASAAVAEAAAARLQSAMQSALLAWREDLPNVFLVCDEKLCVRAASPSLRVPIDQPVPTDRSSWQFLHWFPLRRDGALCGWLCLFPPPSEAFANGFAAEWPGTSAVVTQAEMEARMHRLQLVGEASMWGLRLLLVAIVALFFSWLVTRRLARLATAARADLGTELATTTTRGSDEIAALAQALAESRQRVHSLLEELGARDRARREWIAQVSHDLRTPLTALVARLERALPVADRLLAQSTAGAETRGDTDELRAAIDVSLADADRVAQLARDLLEAARLDLPNQLDLEPLLVGELVARVGQELTPLAAKSGLALRVAPAAGLPSVTGDGRRLLRVLENLVRNAIEHARTHVEVRAAAAPNGVGVEVLDDGPGLLADPQASDARRADAAGLGLQIARRLLEAHGSALELADRPEGGCRSRFVLPAASS